MNTNPKLTGADRIGNGLIAVGLIAYAVLGTFEQSWVRAVLVMLGLVFGIGGIGGT